VCMADKGTEKRKLKANLTICFTVLQDHSAAGTRIS